MRVLSLLFVICAAIIAATATLLLAASAAAPSPSSYPPPPASCFGPGTGRGAINCRAPGATSNPTLPPIVTDAPSFIRSVKNGKLYTAGAGNDTIKVVHLYSDTDDLYEMGYAFGQLLPQELADMFLDTEPYLVDLLEKAVPKLPKWLGEIVIKYGGPFALDLLADLLKKTTPAQYQAEWKGIADGATAAGVKCSIKNIEHIALLPQLSKASCSALSSINDASENGDCIQLRTLDFAPSLMVGTYSSIVVYHFNKKPMLANFGYMALTGCLSCQSYNPVTGASIFGGEKDWGGPQTLIPTGYPWMQLFRRAMEFDNLNQINAFIQNYTNTKINPQDSDTVAIHLLFTESVSKTHVGWEIGYNYSKKFDWYTHKNSTTLHQDRKGLIWWSKNDDSFPHTSCTNDMLQGRYGKISADWFQQIYSPSDLTGDTQVVSADLTNMKAYVANSRKADISEGPLCAYYRQRTLFDMKALFDEKQ